MPQQLHLSQKEIGQTSMFFPVVGVVVGVCLIGIDFLARQLWSELLLISVCTVIGWLIVTGGFHLDGLMDMCDGIFSGRPREEMLQIMKDSHVGAFGVIGLISLLLLKISALWTIPTEQIRESLLIAPILGRWSMTYSAVLFRYAREEGGMGGAFAAFSDWKCLLFATLFTIAVAVALYHSGAILLLIVVPAVVTLIAWRLARQLGGLTGDTYGALCELTETFCLLVIATK